ncbi:hypothetical protein ACSBR2_036045 [Camellia fascicularis]
MSSLVLFGVWWQRQQQRKARGGRGSHQQQRRSSGPSYQKVSGRLSRGVVFIVPPGHPVITIASKNQNLQIVCFDVNALNNEKFPLTSSHTIFFLLSLLATFFGLKLSIDIRGNDVPLRNYNGKVVLIVNVASKWQKRNNPCNSLQSHLREEIGEAVWRRFLGGNNKMVVYSSPAKSSSKYFVHVLHNEHPVPMPVLLVSCILTRTVITRSILIT